MKLTSCAVKILEIFGTAADIEDIVAFKSVENGERTEKTAEPTVILTSKYPRFRVGYRIKSLVESEANTRNGDSKNVTQLFRILIQKIFVDSGFWVNTTAKIIIQENDEAIQACISK